MAAFGAAAAAARSAWADLMETGESVVSLYDAQGPRQVDVEGLASWARVSHEPGIAEAAAYGAGLSFEHVGRLVAELHLPLGTGDGEALRIADRAVALFTRLRRDSLYFTRPWLGAGSRVASEWVVDLSIPWLYLHDDTPADAAAAGGTPSLTYAALASALRARVETLIEDAIPVPMLYDNGPPFGTTGSPYTALDPATSRWARCFFQPGEPRRVEVQGPRCTYRIPGLVVVSAFGPLGQGDGGLQAIVDVADAALRARGLTSARLGTPYAGTGYRDGPWWRVDVACPFAADTIG